MAIDADDLDERCTFRLYSRRLGRRRRPRRPTHTRFRTWKEALRDDTRRPDNPFAASERRRALRRAAGRIHHPRSLAGSARRRGSARTRVERALDVACGTGHVDGRARRLHATSVVGVDVSPEMLRVARAHGRTSTYLLGAAPSESLPFARRRLRRGHVLFGRPLVRPGALLRRAAPRAAAGRLGRRCTTTTSSARWSDVPEFADWSRRRCSSAIRCRRATRRSAIRAPRRPPASSSVGDELFDDDIEMTHERVRRLPAHDQQLRRRRGAGHAACRVRDVAARVDRAVLRDAPRRGRCASSARSPACAVFAVATDVASAEDAPQRLAARAARDLVDEPELARQLRPRTAGRARTRGSSSSDGGAPRSGGDDVRDDALAPFVVGHTDDAHVVRRRDGARARLRPRSGSR